jgi:general nucleoside transport system ATP-binding protein
MSATQLAESSDPAGSAVMSGLRLKATPPLLDATGVSKRFGSLVALENVDFKLTPGSFHALLGENGAGKSTLVKCIMGFYQADSGEISLAGKPISVRSPKEAQRHGIGMVYQHFTLVENMSVAENLVLARADVPRVIDWKQEKQAIERFMDGMPFRIQPDRMVRKLAAGEKQKLEILKQLYLGSKIVILDEPTSVLTPQEADEVLGMLRQMAHDGLVSVAMITHKFREVLAYSDEVTVLRRGRLAGTGKTKDLTAEAMAEMMVGAEVPRAAIDRLERAESELLLELDGLCANDDLGLPVLESLSFGVRAGEIVGIAGVSGNGQDELVEVLAGQRPSASGGVRVGGKAYRPTRLEMREQRVRLLPEAPLKNACVGGMTVAENIGFRSYDVTPCTQLGVFVNSRVLRSRARTAIREYGIKTPSADAPISGLSGGNVQRAVLARELTGEVAVLIAANPCFGLDFAAVSEIRTRIMAARNAGTAVLLVSSDLEEIFALSDRILVMSEGKVVYESRAADANIAEIGRHMGGAHH